MAEVRLPDLRTRLRLDTGGFQQGARQARRTLGDLGRGFGATSALATAGILGIGAALVRTAVDVDLGLRKVNSLFGLTGEAAEQSFGAMRSQLRDLSDEIGVAQSELVDGLYQAISAGVPKDNAFSFMRVAAKAAIAGVTDTNTAVEGLSKAINAFGLDFADASHVADSMFTTVNKGIVTFEELSGHMYAAAPAAAAAGVSLEETNAALTALTLGSIPMAEAATRVQAVLSAVARKGDELGPIFRKLGFQSAEVAIKQKGLKFALDAIHKAAGGSQGQLLKYLGRVEAAQAVNTLAGIGADRFTQAIKDQEEAVGASAKAFEELEKSAGRRLQRSFVTLQNIGTDLASRMLPTIADLAETTSVLVTTIDDLPGPVKAAAASLIFLKVAGGGVAGAFRGIQRGVLTLQGTLAGLKFIGALESLNRGTQAGGAFRQSLNGVRSSARSLTGALAGMIGSALNPVNLAVVAATAAFTAWIVKKQKAAAASRSFTDALRQESEGLVGATDEAVLSLLREADIMDDIRRSGVPLARILRSVRGELELTADEQAKLLTAPGVTEAFGSLISGESASVLRQLERMRKQFGLSKEEFEQLREAERTLAETEGGHAGTVQTLTERYAGLNDSVKASKESLDLYKGALDAVLGVHLDEDKAILAQRNAIAALGKSLKDNSKKLTFFEDGTLKMNAAGRETQGAFLAAVDGIETATLAWAESEGVADDHNAITNEMIERLRALKKRFPELKTQIDGYIEKLKKIPKGVDTRLKVTVPEVLLAINKDLKTITARRIRINTFHTGGFVPGPIGRERLILAKGGERVQTRSEASRAAAPITIIINESRTPRATGAEVERRLAAAQAHDARIARMHR